jgi:hypothetical protein
VPTDAERFRFLAEHKLSVVWYDDGASIHWRERWPEPGKAASYRNLSRARSLAEAVDIIIRKYLRKHRGLERQESDEHSLGVRMLEVRGWVS